MSFITQWTLKNFFWPLFLRHFWQNSKKFNRQRSHRFFLNSFFLDFLFYYFPNVLRLKKLRKKIFLSPLLLGDKANHSKTLIRWFVCLLRMFTPLNIINQTLKRCVQQPRLPQQRWSLTSVNTAHCPSSTFLRLYRIHVKKTTMSIQHFN